MNSIERFFEKLVAAEAEITRKFLKIVPEDKYDRQPHPRIIMPRVLASQIAELPGWIPMGINTDVLDFSVGDYKPTLVNNNKELIAIFEENQKKAMDALPKTT